MDTNLTPDELAAEHTARVAEIQRPLHEVRAFFAAEDAALHPSEVVVKALFDAELDLAEARAALADFHQKRVEQEEKNDKNMRILKDELFRTQVAMR